MSKQNILVTLAIILFAVVPVVLFATLSVNKTVASGQYDDLAVCLNEKGAKMYGAYWCSHCKAQKEMFGDSWSKVSYVECSLPGGQGQTDECKEAGIEGYPTWEFGDGERVGGEISLKDLAKKTECPLENIK